MHSQLNLPLSTLLVRLLALYSIKKQLIKALYGQPNMMKQIILRILILPPQEIISLVPKNISIFIILTSCYTKQFWNTNHWLLQYCPTILKLVPNEFLSLLTNEQHLYLESSSILLLYLENVTSSNEPYGGTLGPHQPPALA